MKTQIHDTIEIENEIFSFKNDSSKAYITNRKTGYWCVLRLPYIRSCGARLVYKKNKEFIFHDINKRNVFYYDFKQKIFLCFVYEEGSHKLLATYLLDKEMNSSAGLKPFPLISTKKYNLEYYSNKELNNEYSFIGDGKELSLNFYLNELRFSDIEHIFNSYESKTDYLIGFHKGHYLGKPFWTQEDLTINFVKLK